MDTYYSNTEKSSVLKQDNIRKRIFIDICIFLLLAFIGWLSIFSIEYTKEQHIGTELLLLKKSYARQLIWILIALLIGIIILSIKSVILTTLSAVLYIKGLVIMLLTVFFGHYNRGSQSWITIGGISIQFAEVMLFITVLFLSKYLSNINFNIHKQQHRINALLIFIVPFILTVLQKELGLALVFLVLIFVLYREGVPGYFIGIPFYIGLVTLFSIAIPPPVFITIIVAIALLIFLFTIKIFLKNKFFFIFLVISTGFTIVLQMYILPWVINKTLKPYQIKRIYSTFKWSDPPTRYTETDLINSFENAQNKKRKHDNNYNVYQSIVAIGSGGFFGKGLLKNTQTRLNFVPEHSTDFIFCSLSESFGFLGITVLLILFATIIFRFITYAENQQNVQIRTYTYGFVSILCFHIFVNIGMTIGIFPVIGIPLPFISYGGSSFLTFSVMYFVLLRLSIRN